MTRPNLLLLLALAVAVPLSLLCGRVWLDPWTTPNAAVILGELRLPRALLAVTIGAGLGAAGAAMQGYLRNPLADPGLFGIAPGAALGAVVSLLLGMASGWWLPLFALAGAAGAMALLALIAGLASGLIGYGMGYLTLRLRGAFFAIASLALAVVLQTLVVNWDFVGGSRGAYVIRPEEAPIIGSYIQYLFLCMLALAVIAIAVARIIERSRLGYGFATIRDDELAAEACGVPTLHLKLVATTISGF